MKRYIVPIVFLCAIATVCHSEERWALLVGIDQYFSSSITPLRGAVQDTKALRDVLIEHARFSSDNVFTLTSNDEANLPTLGNIVTKLDYMAEKAGPGDLFLFFFAGHGVFLEKENYLLAYESDIRPLLLTKTGLSVEELNQYLSKIQTGNTILILDACRNSPRSGRGDEDNELTNSLMESLGKFDVTIYASDIGGRAYEWPGRARGFFSITLEEALEGKADYDSNGEITLNEVGSYLVNRVPDLVSRELGGGRTQLPRINISGDPRAGSMVLSWIAEQGQIAGNELPPPDVPLTGATTPDASSSDSSQSDESILAVNWVDASGGFFGANITEAAAKRSALEQARRRAVEIALGSEERVQEFEMPWASLHNFHQAFTALNQSDLYGRIVEEEEPVWAPVEKIEIRPGEPPALLYSVKLRAKVVKEKSHTIQSRSQTSPAFSLSLKLNSDVFSVDEEMIVSITPSQDCYITVFNALPDHTVLVLSAPRKDSPAASHGQPFVVSTKAMASSRYGNSSPSVGKMEDIGSVLVIATTENTPLLSEELEAPSSGMATSDEGVALEVLPSYESALEVISGWLVNIPLDKRASSIQQYEVKTRDPSARWVDASGGFFGANIAEAEAKQSALEQARRRAVEIALNGEETTRELETSCTSLDDFHQAFAALNESGIYGRIVEESEPIWGPAEKIEIRPGEPPVPIYSVNLRAKVAREKSYVVHSRSQESPDFSISIELNSGEFRVGKEMIASITPSQDCYITVFNALPDHTVLVLSTPRRDAPAAVHGQPFVVSNKVALCSIDGNISSSEADGKEAGSILVIATMENIPLQPGKVEAKDSDTTIEILPSYEYALEVINSWLINIPLSKRTFSIMQYQIKVN